MYVCRREGYEMDPIGIARKFERYLYDRGERTQIDDTKRTQQKQGIFLTQTYASLQT